MTTPSWDDAYSGSVPPPWDLGEPQPAFVRLAEQGLLTGQVLDAGCGTGEQTLLAASSGADALGVDVSPLALEQARGKAAARGIPAAAGGQADRAAAGGQADGAAAGGQAGPTGTARFEVADALNLAELGMTFDTIIDSGLFHVFDDEARARYVSSLASVLRPGGRLFLMCFSDRQPGEFGPRRVSQDELRTAFGEGWTILAIEADAFGINPGAFGTATAQAWLATISREVPPPR